MESYYWLMLPVLLSDQEPVPKLAEAHRSPRVRIMVSLDPNCDGQGPLPYSPVLPARPLIRGIICRSSQRSRPQGALSGFRPAQYLDFEKLIERYRRLFLFVNLQESSSS